VKLNSDLDHGLYKITLACCPPARHRPVDRVFDVRVSCALALLNGSGVTVSLLLRFRPADLTVESNNSVRAV
jgi:hypothetical protein